MRKPEDFSYPVDRFTSEQLHWCWWYEAETGFEPVMCDFVAGNQSFNDAKWWNIWWFEAWCKETQATVRHGPHPRQTT